MGSKLESYGLRWAPYVTGASNTTSGSPIAFTEAVTEARTGRNAMGLSQAISFLLEMRGIRLADQHFQRRVATALIKLESILETARDNADEVYSTVENARAEFIAGNNDIVITDYFTRANTTFPLVNRETGEVEQVPITLMETTPSVANLTRARPEAYLIPRTWSDIVEKLEILGLEVQTLEYEFHGMVESLNITSSVLDEALYEGHVLNTVTTNQVMKEVSLAKIVC